MRSLRHPSRRRATRVVARVLIYALLSSLAPPLPPASAAAAGRPAARVPLPAPLALPEQRPGLPAAASPRPTAGVRAQASRAAAAMPPVSAPAALALTSVSPAPVAATLATAPATSAAAIELPTTDRSSLANESAAGIAAPQTTAPDAARAHTYPAGWNLVSVPLGPQNPSPAVVFGGVPNPLWLYDYLGGQTIGLGETGFRDVAPGRVYWLLLGAPATVSVQGNPVNPGAPYRLPFGTGWNGIATPWLTGVEWTDARVSVRNGSTTLPLGEAITQGWIEELRSFEPGSGTYGTLPANGTGQLQPWQGYELYATVAGELILAAPPADTTPPTVELVGLPDGGSITEPTPIVGTIDDPNLTEWRLEWGRLGSPSWLPLGSGGGPVSNGLLGTLDPTLARNGIYAVQLVAVDATGLTSTIRRTVVVQGNQKIGHFTVSFVDLEVPVSGIPIRLTRTYDSRDVRPGDFGPGWRLDIASLEVQENATPGLGWPLQSSGGPFPQICFAPAKPHYTTVNMPGGRVLEFDMTLTPQCQLGVISAATVGYTPRPGTLGTLAPVGGGEVLVANSELYDYSGGLYDPAGYVYTDPEGTSYTISQQTGLQSLQDLNGNQLTITPAGVLHSSGRSVGFTRDGFGRITKITDPDGNFMTYGYDSNGDLSTFTDRELAVSTYGYSVVFPHYLVEITDPRGIKPIQNEYYPDGRLSKHTDAYGKTIEYTHDVSARQEIVKDRDGKLRVLEYDARGNVVKEVDPEGNQVLRTFDGRDNRLTETEPHPAGTTNPAKTTYTYDLSDNLRTVTDALGNLTEYTYNARKQVLTSNDARGKLTTNEYDVKGNLTKTTDAAGNVTEHTYDARGNLLTQKVTVDGVSQTTQYTYDAYGNQTKETDATGHETTFSYDSKGNRLTQGTTRTTPGGVETLLTSYEYDKNGRLLKTTDPDLSFTRTAYDALGKQIEGYDKLNRKTAYQYDLMGRLEKTSYPDLSTEESTYDGEGRRLTSKDRGGRITQYAYDGVGRLRFTTYPDGAVVENRYDAAGRLVQTIDARLKATFYEYDQSGRRKKAIDALNHATEFFYDEVGNQTAVKDARGATTSFEYDELNRRVKTVYPDLSFSITAYDSLGRRVSETDQAGKVTQFRYDALGRLAKVIDAKLQETVYGYDELGNRVSQHDANLHTTSFEYDKLGRETKRTLSDGSAESKTYDLAGNLETRTDFLGRQTGYGYDLSNRLTSKTYPDGTGVGFTYTSSGRRQTAVDARGTTSYGYDVRDRLTSLTYPDSRRLEHGHDGNGNRTSLTARIGGTSYTTGYAYDDLSRLATVTDPLARTYGYGYDENGNRTGLGQPNGTATSYTYNSLNRLTNLSTAGPSGTVQGYAFTLGPAGNRERIDEADGSVRAYTYDDLYRLTGETVTIGGANQYGKVFEYDPVGNRQRQTTTLGPAGTAGGALQPGVIDYGYDTRDRLLTETGIAGGYGYDANGNLTTKDGEATYAWDFENRLTKVTKTDGTVVEHTYDADGNRVQTTTTLPAQPATTTNFLVDTSGGLSQVVAETDAGNSLKALYVRGLDDLLSVMRPDGGGGWTTRFYHADGIGSVRQLTDESGVVTDTYTLSAFGELLSHTGTDPQPYLFAGEPYDPNIGFQYHRERWLQVSTGRFLGMDPFDGLAFEPLTLHRYLYASANPVNYRDPSGRQSIGELSAIGAIIGVLVSMAIPAHSWKERVLLTVFGAALGAIGGWMYGVSVLGAPLVIPGASALGVGSVWVLPPFLRGTLIEDGLGLLARTLPRTYPVIDRFVNGTIGSIKSMDLGARTYQSTTTITRVVLNYAREVSTWPGRLTPFAGQGPIPSSAIQARELILAIPPGATGAQLQAIHAAVVQASLLPSAVTVVTVTVR